MHVLAQTLPQTIVVQEESWKFWLMMIIGIMTLITTILLPFVLSGIGSIKDRLNNGDDKFDLHSKALAVLETQNKVMSDAFTELSKDLKRLVEKLNDNHIEGTGAVDRLAREVEREFSRKEDVARLEEKMDAQHAETMRAIADIRRHT